MVDYIFPQNYITQEGSHEKKAVKTCCMSDDLSGDMLAPSWPNLVLRISVISKKNSKNKCDSKNNNLCE